MREPVQELSSPPPGAGFQAWLSQDPGQLVLAQERLVVGELSAAIFGYHLLQIGALGEEISYLDVCPIKHKTLIRPDLERPRPDLLSKVENLSIATDSVDAVILPHTLDFVSDPRQALREVERVLIPEGHLIITGFNPWSLWGLRRLLPGSRSRVPWNGHFVSYPRLHDWLSLLGFDIERTEVRMFRPPVRHPGSMTKLAFMERWGRRMWPWAAGIYAVKAIKRVSTLTPVGPRWRLLGKVGKRVIEPSTRGMNNG